MCSLYPFCFWCPHYFVYTKSNEIFANFSSDQLLNSAYQAQENFKAQAAVFDGSFFSLGDFDGTLPGFIKMAPLAIGTTFFRPFIWEVRNLVMLLSALEGLILLFFTMKIFLIPKYLFTLIKSLFNDPLVLYCFVFSLIFGSIYRHQHF